MLRTSEKGFTLVELAIVMIIIGLLLGGVLKGQELIENARITAAIKTVKPIETAMYSFRASYGALPGDMTAAAAQQRLPDCTGDCTIGTGNANSRLDGGPTCWTCGYTYLNTSENQQFWFQLAAAGLFDGIQATGTNGGTVPVAWGVTSPSASMDGVGYEIAHFEVPTLRGPTLIMKHFPGNSAGVTHYEGIANASALTPRQAHQFDTKLDNGLPLTGRVIAFEASVGSGCGDRWSTAVNEYHDTANNENNCNMLIKIGG